MDEKQPCFEPNQKKFPNAIFFSSGVKTSDLLSYSCSRIGSRNSSSGLLDELARESFSPCPFVLKHTHSNVEGDSTKY